MNVEAYTDVTKILKMAAAASSPLCGLLCGESPSPSTPPSAGANNVEQWGVWLCKPLLNPPLSSSSSQSHVGGERGGTLEPLDPASLHKEKTPGAQLRSCGWQAIFQFLYPSSHPTNHLGNASRPHGPGAGAANPIVAAQAPVEAGLGALHQNLPSAGSGDRSALESDKRGLGRAALSLLSPTAFVRE